MNKTDLRNFFRPIVIAFLLINAICLVFAKRLDEKNIDHIVLIFGNLILFTLTIIACFIHIKAINNSNPYAFVRGVTTASIMKLFVIAASVAIYFVTAKTKSVYAIAVSLLFYIVYSIFEVKGAMRLNKNKNAKD